MPNNHDRIATSFLYTVNPLKMGVSESNGTPKSSILIGFSIINHPFWGTSIFGNTQIDGFYHPWNSYIPPYTKENHLQRGDMLVTRRGIQSASFRLDILGRNFRNPPFCAASSWVFVTNGFCLKVVPLKSMGEKGRFSLPGFFFLN